MHLTTILFCRTSSYRTLSQQRNSWSTGCHVGITLDIFFISMYVLTDICTICHFSFLPYYSKANCIIHMVVAIQSGNSACVLGTQGSDPNSEDFPLFWLIIMVVLCFVLFFPVCQIYSKMCCILIKKFWEKKHSVLFANINNHW